MYFLFPDGHSLYQFSAIVQQDTTTLVAYDNTRLLISQFSGSNSGTAWLVLWLGSHRIKIKVLARSETSLEGQSPSFLVISRFQFLAVGGLSSNNFVLWCLAFCVFCFVLFFWLSASYSSHQWEALLSSLPMLAPLKQDCVCLQGQQEDLTL